MKTKLFYCSLLAAALSVSVSRADDKTLGQKTSDTLEKAKDKTVEAGHVVAEDTKKAANAVVNETKKVAAEVKDAVTPDSDAHKVDVTLTGHRIEMSRDLSPGKTAFVVHNTGKAKHNFKIEGQGITKDFLMAVDPNDTKVLHVDLKSGDYKVFIPGKDGEEVRGSEVSLTVK